MSDLRDQIKKIKIQLNNTCVMCDNLLLQMEGTGMEIIGMQISNLGFQILNIGIQMIKTLNQMPINLLNVKDQIQKIRMELINLEENYNNNMNNNMNNMGMNMNNNIYNIMNYMGMNMNNMGMNNIMDNMEMNNNFEPNNLKRKFNAFFIDMNDNTNNLILDEDITVDEMLKTYLNRINRPDYINNEKITFKYTFNNEILKFGDQTKIKDIQSFSNLLKIEVDIN